MRTPSRTGSLPFRLLGLGLAAALCGACKTAPLPGSDDTPPAIDWFVRNTTTDAVLEFSGNGGPILVNPGDQFHVTCFARDPGGVSEISLTVNSQWSCFMDTFTESAIGDGAPLVHQYEPDEDGEVPVEVFILEDVGDLSTLTCSPGYSFSGGGVTMVASAENFHGGSAVGSLGFTRNY